MTTTLQASDERSAKRLSLVPADGGRVAARTVAELDDAIWTSIVEFLPIPNDLHTDDRDNYDARVAEVAATWQTLLGLRLVTKNLAVLLHPREKTFWRRLLLQSFDFSSRGGFNTEIYVDIPNVEDPDGEEDADEEEEEDSDKNEDVEADGEELEDSTPAEDGTEPSMDQAEKNPQLTALRGRSDTIPKNYLEEDLLEWSKIGIYHRPSQYGFLTTLQQQAAEGSWPETEDPFTLFGDIVRLLQLPHGEDMGGLGEGSYWTDKFLGAPTEAGPNSRFYRFYVMKTLGYVPEFWHWGNGIGDEWEGFTQGAEMEAFITEQLVGKNGEDASEDSFDDCDDRFLFPGCTVADAKRLFDHIREHCRDWRSVCCNSGCDGDTPVFFVGENKSFPHRWTGYMGLKCWT